MSARKNRYKKKLAACRNKFADHKTADQSTQVGTPVKSLTETGIQVDVNDLIEYSARNRPCVRPKIPARIRNAIIIPITAPVVIEGESEKDQIKRHTHENHWLKKEITCVICDDAVRNVLYLPCGHIAVCSLCRLGLTICPICQVVVRGFVPLYTQWLNDFPVIRQSVD